MAQIQEMGWAFVCGLLRVIEWVEPLSKGWVHKRFDDHVEPQFSPAAKALLHNDSQKGCR